MEFNARLPTSDMVADPHSILASCLMCSYFRALCLFRVSRPVFFEASQPPPWETSSSPMGSINCQMLVTLQSLSNPDHPPTLKTNEQLPPGHLYWIWHRPFKFSMPQTSPIIISLPRFTPAQLVSGEMVPSYIQPSNSESLTPSSPSFTLLTFIQQVYSIS